MVPPPREVSNCFYGPETLKRVKLEGEDWWAPGERGGSWTYSMLGLALLPPIFLGLIIDNYESF